MFIYSLENKDALYCVIEQELRNLGIKQTSKLRKSTAGSKRSSSHGRNRVFQRPLDHLPRHPVQLQCGATVEIPSFLVALCRSLEHRLETEGLFRKAGSAARQREIKAHFEAGGLVNSEFHEVDLANILKLFLRELPEPLIPYNFHSTFVRCLNQSVDHLLLACLLLPSTHLNSLAYVMKFLHTVGGYSRMNMMPASNLAIVLGPSLMPSQELQNKHSATQNQATQQEQYISVLQCLIEQAEHIGELPTTLAVQLGFEVPRDNISADTDLRGSLASLDSLGTEKRGRKRRSGSLTRVLNGIRKIVGVRASSPGNDPVADIQNQTSPCILSSASKKRKIDTPGGFSAKKKLEVLLSLPESSVLSSTPARPCMPLQPLLSPAISSATPVCSHPNPQKSPHPQVVKNKHRNRFFTPKSRSESLLQRVTGQSELKQKGRLSFGSKKSAKKQKQVEKLNPVSEEEVTRPRLKRKKSWSSLGGSWGRNMRRLNAPGYNTGTPLLNSPYAIRCQVLGGNSEAVDLSPKSSPKLNFSNEYEEIKNKVSNLENQLNEELVKAQKVSDKLKSGAHTALFVQSEYEKTKEDSEQFNNCQTTNQLAKRLSKELKIRRSGENKVIRSPSARKIGTIRRRSKELSRPTSTSSLVRSPARSTVPIPRSLRRGRPNTVMTGLHQPSPSTNLQKPCSFSEQNLTSDFKSPVQSDDVFKTPSGPASKHVFKTPSSMEFMIPQSPMLRSAQRACSFNINKEHELKNHQEVKRASSYDNVAADSEWSDARSFLASSTPSKQPTTVGRPSIVEIKRNRAGMVLANVKLFSSQLSLAEKQKTSVAKQRTSIEGYVMSPTRVSPRNIKSPKISPPRVPLRASTPHSDGASNKPRRYNNIQTKVNNSLPGDWFVGKENESPFKSPIISLPDGLKDTIYAVCTPKPVLAHLNKSPAALAVKDCNKMTPTGTPKNHCPVIKKPLSVRPIALVRKTPSHYKFETPSRPRPLQATTPLRRSPRLLAAMNLVLSP